MGLNVLGACIAQAGEGYDTPGLEGFQTSERPGNDWARETQVVRMAAKQFKTQIAQWSRGKGIQKPRRLFQPAATRTQTAQAYTPHPLFEEVIPPRHRR